MPVKVPWRIFAVLAVVVGALAITSRGAQDRLPRMPGYDQYQRMQPQIVGSWISGAVNPIWEDNGKAFTYVLTGKRYHFDTLSMKAVESGEASLAAVPGAARGASGARAGAGGQTPAVGRGAVTGGAEQAQVEMPATQMSGCPNVAVARGRQAICVLSPDGTHKAFYRDRNLWIASADGSGEKRVTSDGSDGARIKYGVASWVYGEELSQTTAMWWSPDSRKLGFYRFDESQVKDFYLQTNQTDVQDALDVEAYPKSGAPNPIPDVLVYDLASAKSTTIDVRDGRPFDNAVVGHYVYDIRWLPDSSELLLNRANRRQQVVEFAACSPSTAKCRVIVREEWPTGWIDTDGGPNPRWLGDHKRFVWESGRNGSNNFYLYDLSGTLIAPLTSNSFDATRIVKIDEAAGVMFYLARDGDNFLKEQLHRVGLDGKGDVRLTDPAFTHSVGTCLAGGGGGRGGAGAGTSCGISPDNSFIVDVYQRHDQPPATQLLDATGKVVSQIARSDLSRYEQLGFKKAEQFAYKAADGQTTLYGQISFPSNFDASKKYPVLVPVYGGPVAFSNLPVESFVPPNATAEYGFLIVNVMYRGVPGTGRRGADALYLKLGQTEMDDMAEGIKALWSRPYVDKARVGIYGTSYGGYTAAMQIVRHPEVFAAASASSPPTDWRNYDSIYTERYMWLPDENREGYDAGRVMTYASNLKGRLLLYYGTADNNVHPSNSLQLIRALQQAGKSFEVQVGPDLPHGSVNNQRMMEFFIDNLVVRPER
jgi:dipeptidyl-peptidase-4